MDFKKGLTSRTVLVLAVMLFVACAGSGGGGAAAQDELNNYCEKQQPDLTGKDEVQGDSDLTGELTVWGWYNIVAKDLVQDFQKLYPKVTFEFADFALPDTHTKLITALNSGQGAPDISMVVDREGPRFWELGLLDLSECLAPYEKLFTESKWGKVSRPDGGVQAMPWDGGSVILVYRKDVFDRFGIDPKSIITWDQYISAGKKIVKESNGEVHMLLSNISENPNGTQNSLVRDFAVLSQQNEGAWFSENGGVTIDNPQALEALEMLKRFREEGITLNDLASAQAEFETLRQGTVATYPVPNWWSFYPKDQAPKTQGKWGFMLLPAFDPNGARASNFGGSSMAITEQTDDPVAAWKFLEWWLLRVQGRVQSYKIGSLEETVYEPAAKDPFFNQPDAFFGKGWQQLVAQAGNEAPPFSESAQYRTVELEIEQRLSDFLNGELEGEALLEQVSQESEAAS